MYISDGDIPGSTGGGRFPVGSVNSGIFFFTLYAMSDRFLQHNTNTSMFQIHPYVNYLPHLLD